MVITFDETETNQYGLWDYGWLDITRFRYTSPGIDPTDADLIRELTTAPIYQRSFCESPDPWNASSGRHGPFHIQTMSSGWFRRIPADQLMKRVVDAMNDGGFDYPPSDDQMSHITQWVDSVSTRGDTVFVLNAPDDEKVYVEWAHIWFVFTEFICVNREHRELIVAVIGYD